MPSLGLDLEEGASTGAAVEIENASSGSFSLATLPGMDAAVEFATSALGVSDETAETYVPWIVVAVVIYALLKLAGSLLSTGGDKYKKSVGDAVLLAGCCAAQGSAESATAAAACP